MKQNELNEAINELIELSPLVVIKRGSNGAMGLHRFQEILERPARSADVIDTTGAGDSFAAGFLSNWLETGDLSAALDKGIR